jgi:hypothetical protein
LETFIRLDLSSSNVAVGIHALINGHEYHCVAIRMRCWLMDACFVFSAAVLTDIRGARICHVTRKANDYQQQGTV